MKTHERRQRLRTTLILVVFVIGLGLLLTRCPANRDGMPGQLAQAMEETSAAARSGALGLQMWIDGRSTAQVTSVQLSDARDQVVNAYQGIAELRAQDPADVERQRMLTGAMTTIIGELNAAAAVARHVAAEPKPDKSRHDLLASANALEKGYR